MFYFNTTREVHIGDRVRGVGEYDGVNLTGRFGTVREVDIGRPGIQFDIPHNGFHNLRGMVPDRTGFWVDVRHLEYAGNAPTEVIAEGQKRCSRCGNILDNSAFGLGALMFKNECDVCVRNRLKSSHGYHWGRDNIRYTLESGKITLGAEIEIDDWDDGGDPSAVLENVLDCAEKLHAPAIIHAEHDGSLCNNGIECVTAPLTIKQWASASVREQISVLLDSASDNGYAFSDDDHAGLHVHIGRKDLCGDDRTVSDAVGLLMGWAITSLWDKGFKRLSRRYDLEYTHLYNDGAGLRSLYNTGATDDRYYAVNIQNRKTIEVRIFKGAQTLEDVLFAVDMSYMLAKWATKKIGAFVKRGAYAVRDGKYDDATEYAERVTWGALLKYSKFTESTIHYMRRFGIEV